MATWFQGQLRRLHPASAARAFERGARILHFLGGMSVDVVGRARGLAGEDDDHAARAGRGRRVRRRLHRPLRTTSSSSGTAGGGSSCASRSTSPDRIIPVDPADAAEARPGAARVVPGRLPASRLPPDRPRLRRSSRDMPGLTGPEVEALYASGDAVAFRRESRPMKVLDDRRAAAARGALRADRARVEPGRAGRLHRRAPRRDAAAGAGRRARVDRRAGAAPTAPRRSPSNERTPEFAFVRALAIEAYYCDFVAPGQRRAGRVGGDRLQLRRSRRACARTGRTWGSHEGPLRRRRGRVRRRRRRRRRRARRSAAATCCCSRRART